jgi:hypothetical protein
MSPIRSRSPRLLFAALVGVAALGLAAPSSADSWSRNYDHHHRHHSWQRSHGQRGFGQRGPIAPTRVYGGQRYGYAARPPCEDRGSSSLWSGSYGFSQIYLQYDQGYAWQRGSRSGYGRDQGRDHDDDRDWDDD